MKISLIVAISEESVIGKDNQLIWHLPADMKFFRDKTMGHCVVTGRKNYESIPEKFRPLPGRTNVVITRQKDYSAPGAHVVFSIEEALSFCAKQNEKEVFVIGGAQIFEEMLQKDLVDKMYITHVKKYYEGNVFFPVFNTSEWEKRIISVHAPDEKNEAELEFCEYLKK
jgi:dihydrofolate reductase